MRSKVYLLLIRACLIMVLNSSRNSQNLCLRVSVNNLWLSVVSSGISLIISPSVVVVIVDLFPLKTLLHLNLLPLQSGPRHAIDCLFTIFLSLQLNETITLTQLGHRVMDYICSYNAIEVLLEVIDEYFFCHRDVQVSHINLKLLTFGTI